MLIFGCFSCFLQPAFGRGSMDQPQFIENNHLNFRSFIKESYNIVEGRNTTSDDINASDNYVEIESVIETDDGHPNTDDDVQSLVSNDVLAFLINKNQRVASNNLENNNIDIEMGKY